jgi:hypothetical protein
MPFLNRLKVEKVLGQDWWITLDFLVYRHVPSEYLSDDFKVIVPIGFYTDFASVPRIPVIYDHVGNIAHEAAVIHDYLYRADSVPFVTKDVADRTFYDAMGDLGIEERYRRVMFDGVHVGGLTSFHVHKALDKMEA